MPAADQAHFGYRAVNIDNKQAMVDSVFRSVAWRYDLMNDLMSAGLHRLWKDALVTTLNPPKSDRCFAVVDVAGGTGDVAFRIAAAGGSGTAVTVCDINCEMLLVGRERARERTQEHARSDGLGTVEFVAGNAESLPLRGGRFDACTIAFGIRNVPRIDAALREFYRVLHPGGRFLCLEFSSVDVPGLDAFYDFYSFNVIPALGGAVTGDAAAYRYLVESIRRFPRPPAFADMIAAAGFRRVSHSALTGGIVTLYSAWRL